MQTQWTLDDIDWRAIAADRTRADPFLYYLVTAASFVESGADLYTSTLADHVRDPVAQRWLQHSWQPEELQHGQALRKYAELVWPELDWSRGFADFLAEYSLLCTPQALNPSPVLEMAARCAVEIGTSTLYTALHRYAQDPVLRDLAARIRQDEVRHYDHFRHFFEAGRGAQAIGRLDVLRTLLARLGEAEGQDAFIAFKHAWILRHPVGAFRDEAFDSFIARLRPVMRSCYPYRMAVKMLLRPLRLNPRLNDLSVPLLQRWAQWRMF
ncbi:MAG TPA: ferritin-like domain-containing protein [Burkholderiales bacterium]|nr:ferritin-like domain-containing protein [Burkholderiales bacterium]HUP09009.1 ferritin-like domain-containing protein [Caldimonas sp.]